MCPACLATAGWIATGASSAGGLAAFAVRPKPNRTERKVYADIQDIAMPEVASLEAWLSARKKLLAQEKAFNIQRDAPTEARHALPRVLLEKDYAFEGPQGRRTLGDLLEGRRQLTCAGFATTTGTEYADTWAPTKRSRTSTALSRAASSRP